MFKRYDRSMSVIRFSLAHQFATPLVPLPYSLWVLLECLGSSEFLGPEICPQTGLRIAKCWHAAFGRGAGAGRDNRMNGLLEPIQ